MHITDFIALAVGFVACVTDLRTRRIPNVLTFGAAAVGVLFHTITGGAPGLAGALGAWALGIVLFFPPFALRGMGAGDVKLLAALGAWLGPLPTVWLALYTGVAGGLLALVVAAARGYLRQAVSNIWTLLAYWQIVGIRPFDELTLATSRGPRLAYALPIFAGTVMTIWLR